MKNDWTSGLLRSGDRVIVDGRLATIHQVTPTGNLVVHYDDDDEPIEAAMTCLVYDTRKRRTVNWA